MTQFNTVEKVRVFSGPDLSYAESATAMAGTRVSTRLIRIHELDGLRGMLALFVVLYHLMGSFAGLKQIISSSAPILMQGWYAVDVFFVMSGFVMMHVYGSAFFKKIHAGDFFNFMYARFARLYPVHFFALVMMCFALLPFIYNSSEFLSAAGRYSLGTLAGSVFLLHSPWIDYRTWNYPSWSISAEWHAYLIFPFLVRFFKPGAYARSAAAIGFGVLLPFLIYLVDLTPDQYVTNGVMVFFRVLPLFVAGMGLYIWQPRVAKISLFQGGVVISATLLCLSFSALTPAAVLFVPLLVLAVMKQESLRRVFSSKLLLWLGKISYSLYMTHALIESFVGSLLRFVGRHFGIGLPSSPGVLLVCWIGSVVLSVGLGWLTWRLIEVPGRSLLLGVRG